MRRPASTLALSGGILALLAGCGAGASESASPQASASAVEVPLSAIAPAPSAPPPVASASAVPVAPPVASVDMFTEEKRAGWLLAQDPNFSKLHELIVAQSWPAAEAEVSRLLATKPERLEMEVAERGLLGRLAVLAGDAKVADSAYEAVRALWKDPKAAVAAIDAEPVSEGDALEVHNKRIGQSLLAVGEALFYAADKERARSGAMTPPPALAGASDQKHILDFIRKSITPWVTRRQQALDASEKAYLKILDLQPVPPPIWVVAAAERVGTMWSKFVSDFQAVPVPVDFKHQPDLMALYQQQLAEASAPHEAHARSAFLKCVELGTKFNVQNEHTKLCKEYLDAHPDTAAAKP